MPDIKKLKDIFELAKSVVYPDGFERGKRDFNRDVALFIHEARTKDCCEKWDEDVLKKFLKKRCNSVSDLRPNYFDRKQQERIERSYRVGELLREMALQPDQLVVRKNDIDFYNEIFQHEILKITTKDGGDHKWASIHRMAAGLQPYVFSTVSSDRFVKYGLNYLQQNYDASIKCEKDWYKDSHTLLKLVYEAFGATTTEQKDEVPLYAWAICKYAEKKLKEAKAKKAGSIKNAK